MPSIYLAGLPIPGPEVLELARVIDDQGSPRNWKPRTAAAPASSLLISTSASPSFVRSRTGRRPARSPNSGACSFRNIRPASGMAWSIPPNTVSR